MSKTSATKARDLRAQADRLDASLNPTAGMSSEEWVSAERHLYIRTEANKLRQEAARLESSRRSK